MHKIIKIGITYIRFSAFLVLFVLFLYILVALANMIGATFYSFWGIISYILLQIILPIYAGLLLFFILYILAESFGKIFIKKDKEENA